MLASVARNIVDHGTSIRQLPAPKALRFEFDSIVKQHISQAERNFDELVSKHNLLVSLYSSVLLFCALKLRRCYIMKDMEKGPSKNSMPHLMHGCSS